MGIKEIEDFIPFIDKKYRLDHFGIAFSRYTEYYADILLDIGLSNLMYEGFYDIVIPKKEKNKIEKNS